MNSKKPLVFLICTGLGHINRGYESFTRECFDALKDNTVFDLYLVKGGGRNAKNEIRIQNLGRNKKITKTLSKFFKTNAYHIEQLSFFFFIIPLIIKKKPSLIYYSDFILGTYLWHLRKIFKLKYRLLFSNGAPNGAPFKTEDHVQQLLPVYIEDALKKGEMIDKQTLLPYAFDINIGERLLKINAREQTRIDLGFSNTQKIILSVGAANNYHKRMNYVINELSLLSNEFFLIILGQFEDETQELMRSAKYKLPGRHIIKSVPYTEVQKYYMAADYFVLASVHEGFPRVAIEALSYGLPCIVHNYAIMQQILNGYGTYIDMRLDGALSDCLKGMNIGHVDKKSRIQYAFDSFSWEKRRGDYQNMLSKQLSVQRNKMVALSVG